MTLVLKPGTVVYQVTDSQDSSTTLKLSKEVIEDLRSSICAYFNLDELIDDLDCDPEPTELYLEKPEILSFCYSRQYTPGTRANYVRKRLLRICYSLNLDHCDFLQVLVEVLETNKLGIKTVVLTEELQVKPSSKNRYCVVSTKE